MTIRGGKGIFITAILALLIATSVYGHGHGHGHNHSHSHHHNHHIEEEIPEHEHRWGTVGPYICCNVHKRLINWLIAISKAE